MASMSRGETFLLDKFAQQSCSATNKIRQSTLGYVFSAGAAGAASTYAMLHSPAAARVPG